jgi:hypothetical protein
MVFPLYVCMSADYIYSKQYLFDIYYSIMDLKVISSAY